MSDPERLRVLTSQALHIGSDTLYELAEFLSQFIVEHMNLDIT